MTRERGGHVTVALRPDALGVDRVCSGELATFLSQGHEGHKPPGPVLHPAGPVSSDLLSDPNPLCPVCDVLVTVVSLLPAQMGVSSRFPPALDGAVRPQRVLLGGLF